MRVLVTGAAGFIGFHVARRLLARGDEVVGIDNLSSYYDPALKRARLDELNRLSGFRFKQIELGDTNQTKTLFAEGGFGRVVHLAAQPGVRYALDHPMVYAESNLVGFLNVLEGCRHNNIEHLVYASSSSVYGANTLQPFAVTDGADHPISLYGATKKANETMAHSYSHLFGLPTTGLRFFTVYGPWGRPDMAIYGFTKKILAGEPIEIFNGGHHTRDFTYIDDIAEGVIRTLDQPAKPNPEWSGDQPDAASSLAPWRVYNIGNASPVELMDLIRIIENACGRKAEMVMRPLQPGDVESTNADVSALVRDVGFRPDTPIEVGITRFVQWYRGYYSV